MTYLKHYHFKNKEIKEGEAIQVELFYSLGGCNYIAGKSEERGIYLIIQPVIKTDKFITFTAFTGIKALIKPLKRQNNKAGEQLVEKVVLISKELARAFKADDKSKLLTLVQSLKTN